MGSFFTGFIKEWQKASNDKGKPGEIRRRKAIGSKRMKNAQDSLATEGSSNHVERQDT